MSVQAHVKFNLAQAVFSLIKNNPNLLHTFTGQHLEIFGQEPLQIQLRLPAREGGPRYFSVKITEHI